MKIWSTIKLIIISVVAVVALTFLTADAPVKIEKKEINLVDLPKTVELIGFENEEFNTKSIINEGTVIFVGNHESIVLADDLEKMLNLKVGRFVVVSNVSDAPWFIKRWQAHTQNTKIKGKNPTPWIYDRNGAIRNFLIVPTSDAVKYFVYKVKDNGVINRVFIGKVKMGTLEGKMTKSEIQDNLSLAVEAINNN